MTTSHRSKVDLWIIPLALLGLLLLFLLLSAIREGDIVGIIGLGSAVALALGSLLVTVPSRYTIAEDTLVIQTGIVRKEIPLAEIRRIHETETWWTLQAGARSMDRITIRYGAGSKLAISPIRKHEFATRLAEAAGLVERDGAWVRADTE